MAGAINNATLIRRELMAKIARYLMDRELEANVDRIPIDMRPKGSADVSRCCIYKDRAVLKYKIMAMLGFEIREEEDELTPLSEYFRRALARESVTDQPLTVVDAACSACGRVNYVVTNMCRGCVARPCMFNCSKDAISFREGRAEIHPEKCVNCGLCMKNCPFHAIVYMPVPCEESCPVGAISKDAEGIEHIDYSRCIYCGKCMVACPFGAILEKSHMVDLFRAFRAGKRMVALVAPAVAGQFRAPLGKILGAIGALGFHRVVEVARGADVTTEREAAEFAEKMEAGQPFMTTSCCPSYTAAVKKHLPELAPFVSHTRTPMQYTSEMVRAEEPGAVLVFVGPCVAKRHEVYHDPNTDYMLSFEELGALFVAAGIDVGESPETVIDAGIDPSGRGYPVSGGVAGAVAKKLGGNAGIRPVLVDGIDKAAIRELKGYVRKCPGNMVEVMACEGGCVNGCNVIANRKIAARQVNEIVNKK